LREAKKEAEGGKRKVREGKETKRNGEPTEGAGSGLHHPAIEDEKHSYSPRKILDHKDSHE